MKTSFQAAHIALSAARLRAPLGPAVEIPELFRLLFRIHKSLRVTPAMAAGVTDRLSDMKDIVALIDANEQPSLKRGPYKKQISN